MFKHLTIENDFAKCWFDNYVGGEGGGCGELVQIVKYIYNFFKL
jgi:hypothetical protein